jgi:2-polyprenyl-3-methyl-5-hydroxy-6-metoxy-1,4-benzoquinol methylase
MDRYRDALRIDGLHDVRSAVLDDLSTYFQMSPEECTRRCIDWEAWSVEEWHQRPRNSPGAITEFYHSTHSWAFDLLWYAYLQAEGYMYPVSTAIAGTLPAGRRGLRHLDFGSGVGTTSQLFLRLGYESDLADISTSLLNFAEFRLKRRGDTARYIDLNSQSLEPGRYDVITAVDTLVHVPDLPATARRLHRALKPGGVLFANFDTRPATRENAWHLYSDDLPLRFQLHRCGFEPQENLDNYTRRYLRVPPIGMAHTVRCVRDWLLFCSPLRPTYRSVRATARRMHDTRALHRTRAVSKRRRGAA